MENILERANDIVNNRSEERDRQYGPFSECMRRTSAIASQMSCKEISTIDAFNVLVALKLAREAYSHKEDNLLDAVAYLGGLNNFINESTVTDQLEIPFEPVKPSGRADIKFAKVRDVKTPEYGSAGAAGLDFFVPNDFETVELAHGEDVLIHSGIKANIPQGMCLLAVNKSGVASSPMAKAVAGMKPKQGPQGLLVGACLIDCDYQGEIHLHVFNASTVHTTIKAGDKLAQFMYLPAPQAKFNLVDEADLYKEHSDRGTGGFGSTND